MPNDGKIISLEDYMALRANLFFLVGFLKVITKDEETLSKIHECTEIIKRVGDA